MPMRFIILALAVAIAAPSAYAASDPSVIVETVSHTPFADRVEALGTLKANDSVSVTANVTERVAVIHFGDGQRVEKGDVLVELTGAEEDALFEEASARAGEAERQYERVKSLVAQGSASESLLDERRRDWDTARALLVAIESRLDDRVIKAPFSGVLGLRNISPGALVEPGDLITTLDDDSVMKLDFAVPSVFLQDLEPGLGIEATARAYGERQFDGVISSIDSRVDPVTRSIQVRALLPNPDRILKPGVLMQVELLRNPREALMVPESALLHLGTEHFVMLVDETNGNLVEKVRVRIGARRAGEVEVVDGLSAGDKVITHGNDKARPGHAVRIQDRLFDSG